MNLTIDCDSLEVEPFLNKIVRVTLTEIDINDLKIDEVYAELDPELVAQYHGKELAKEE